jgi:hypothetical protein
MAKEIRFKSYHRVVEHNEDGTVASDKCHCNFQVRDTADEMLKTWQPYSVDMGATDGAKTCAQMEAESKATAKSTLKIV